MLRKDTKKLEVLCLCAILLFSSVPVSVNAQENGEQQEAAEVPEEAEKQKDLDEKNEDPEKQEETVKTPEEPGGKSEESEEPEEEESEAPKQETEDLTEEPKQPEGTGEGDPSEEPKEQEEGTPEAGAPEDNLHLPGTETDELEEIEKETVNENGKFEETVQMKDQEGLPGATYATAVPAPHAAKIELKFTEVAANVEARAGSIGISPTDPKAGQENRYEYTGGIQTFAAPVDGYYDIYCYGSEGGSTYVSWNSGKHQVGSVNCVNGSKGDMRGGRAWLKKGTVLSITAAVKGGSRTFHETPGMCKDHDVDFAGGIGNAGEASYVVCNGMTILSASGGSAGRMDLRDHPCNGTYTENGTGNRGSMVMNSIGGSVGWQTSQLDASSYGVNAGNGYVRIQFHAAMPALELSVSGTEWTKGEVTLTAKATGTGTGLGSTPYCWEKDEHGNDIWTGNNRYMVSQNGTYACKIRDTAGSSTEAWITVTNIDRLAPEIMLAADTKEWTNDKVTLTATARDADATGADGSSGLMQECYSYKEDDQGDPVWTASDTYEVSQNGTYICKVRDRAGNVAEVTYQVTNIDRLAPRAEVTVNTKEETEGSVTLYMKAEDEAASAADGSSGIDSYCYGKKGENSSAWTKENSYEVSQNGTYICKVRDRAGNVTEVSHTVTNIVQLGRGDENDKNDGTGESESAEEESGRGSGSGESRPPEPVPPVEIPPVDWYEQEDNSDHGGSVIPIVKDPVIPVHQPTDLLTVTDLPVLVTEFRLPEDLPRENGNSKRSDPEEKPERTIVDIPMDQGLLPKRIMRYAAQGTAATSGGVIIYFVLFYVIRSVGILAMNMDQEYVYIGRRRLKKRRGMYQVRIDAYLYSKADTEHFQIKPGRGFVRKYEGKMMIIRYKDRKIQAVIGKEIKVKIPKEVPEPERSR